MTAAAGDPMPGTLAYTEEVLDLLLEQRGTVVEAAGRILADVQARVAAQQLSAADAYALVESEVRANWPALADAVLILTRLDAAQTRPD